MAREMGAGHHGQHVQPVDRHGIEPAMGDWAIPQKAATALNRMDM